MTDILSTISLIFFRDKTSIKFLVGVIIGLGFSISVILGTIGIMNGFETALKTYLRQSSGDILISSHDGPFDVDARLKRVMTDNSVIDYSPVRQIEAFVIANGSAKGIIVWGIHHDSFIKVFDLPMKDLKANEVAIGFELAKNLAVKEGDEITIAFAHGNKEHKDLPLLTKFVVSHIVKHGIYQKDLRMVYVSSTFLNEIQDSDKVNLLALNVKDKSLEGIDEYVKKMQQSLAGYYYVRPFWDEYSTLLKAVQVEKFMIGTILQIVVVVAVFNLIAFIIFINEKKAREIFLLRALGLSNRSLYRVWPFVLLAIWMLSSIISIPMIFFFDYLLHSWSLFELPGNIYALGRLSVELSLYDYGKVFIFSLCWIILISLPLLYRLANKKIAHALRKEFS